MRLGDLAGELLSGDSYDDREWRRRRRDQLSIGGLIALSPLIEVGVAVDAAERAP